MRNYTRIPAPRVTLVNTQTGIVADEWFRFFNNLYTIAYASTTTVTPGTYGTATQVPQITVNDFGNIIAVTNVPIAIDANQIVSGTIASARILGAYTGITGVGILTVGTWNASTITTPYGGTGLTSYTTGDTLYYASGTALTKLAIGASTYINTSSGTAPQWTNPSTITIGKATNLVGGAANQIAYQTATDITGFIVAPTVPSTYLNWSGTAFQWSTITAGSVTSVGGTGTVSGISLSGTVTSSGNLTLGGSLDLSSPPAIGSTTPSTGAFTTGAFSSVASFAAGSVSAPSITRTGDTNTGIFFPSADTIAFTEGGAEAMRINSSGDVGIGTSSPTTRLDVRGNVTIINSPEARIDVAGGGSNFGISSTDSDYATFTSGGNSLGFAIPFGSGLFVCENATGRVGIGTTTPTTELDVVGTGKFTAVTTPSVTAPTTDLTLNAVSTGAIKFVTAGGLQAQINNATTAGPYTLLARAATGNSQKITAFGTANLALQATGGGTISLRTGDESNTQLTIGHTASAVNFVQVNGSATNVPVTVSSQGSDGSVVLQLQSKGTAAVSLVTNGSKQFDVYGNASAVNFIRATGNTAGNAPSFNSLGSDTDIDLTLNPKGAGRIRFGTYTATILTPTGFIEIKDSGGTTRRLLVG